MTGALASDLTRFRDLMTRRLGLQLDDGKSAFLAEVLDRRVKAARSSVEDYLCFLESSGGAREELRLLAGELTVAETYFFRHAPQMEAFAEVALPDRVQVQSHCRRLRILSAGCASGEEAYSLAMLVREHLPDAETWEVSIRGFDVNPAVLEKAVRAQYSAWSLRETTEALSRRWFRAEGRHFAVDDSIRTMVTFEESNLTEDDPMLWRPGAFDVVFCRNVIMYFTPEVAQAVVGRIARSLAPGGYLFLGHAETLRGLSTDFHLRHTHETFYYQRGEASEQMGAVARPATGRTALSPAAPLAAAVETADSWVEAIRGASDRVQALTATSSAGAVRPPDSRLPATGARGRPAEPGWDLGVAMGLLRQERFAEAEAVIRGLPSEAARNPDVLLLRAVLLAHAGRSMEAERVCTNLLALDELSAGAHYVTALCREHAGDHAGAIDCDQVAIYLDPGFAMPHLHWGLQARRAGDRQTARAKLREALLLLEREDASRVLLFGGGFSREALVGLCRAELAACGGDR